MKTEVANLKLALEAVQPAGGSETVCEDNFYSICAEWLHPKSPRRAKLTESERLQALSLCDAFGNLKPSQIKALDLEDDFSLITESTEESIRACAEYILGVVKTRNLANCFAW